MYRFAVQISTALFALLAISVAHAASIRFEAFGPFSVRSTAEGQLSSDSQELRTHTTAELQVKYVASAAHCSSVRMHFLLDGADRGVSEPVSPGRSTGYFDFGAVAAGEHVVGLRAEGLVGGCNRGTLASWDGFAILRTSVASDAGPDSRAASLGAVVFYAMTVSNGWGHRRRGVYVTAVGDVYAFEYDPAERDWSPAADGSGRIALFDLQERFLHHTRWLAKLDEQELKTCESALASIKGTPYPTTPGDGRYDAPREFRGAYRLDPGSGRYADAPCAQEAR